ncbi:hypothetical protein E6P09_07070 [Haloferax mediterranei ATCC 33500]|uniref:DUF7313 domain-containing protein n=1 Tax=Haloferax mediterranei (strain ATCC 33500 / DSM 1411 / JCM 8866 / NBRC 14739 / NCIMB 2177 / R-4) TaxID=523841 RepID=I3R2S0_HALMT|nr:hypothetical protein [Haloferax mediterranei]AFK18530.1 hypothetical protein HFX_0807 [Haloferax mediterranei ATCC 33500]AHZ22090.1 hypothetical protein BM92_05195 [Haloferax mediterranei ATCC 33500]EMA02196.1 hypothetical protein C439_06435 [Haloferax mediterranei ATCC 33500]MDX5988620.1 hypothetical protein [Haloferax mediterranei ATCC 33500]QCQ75035.1 hypothetical protein E6P09_07070 [Haloferax mediterranei ATCC 33500]
MQPLQFLVPLDQLLAVEPVIAHVALAFVLANFATRFLAHRAHVQQAAKDGDEAVSRYIPHILTTVGLVLASFLFLLVEPHGGMVLSVLVIGLFVTDFFEFEARKVEARNGRSLDRPNGSLAASVLVFLYAAYQSLFFVIADVWNAVI